MNPTDPTASTPGSALPQKTGETRACPVCKRPHQAYALFPPACQKSDDGYTYFVDGKPA